MTRQDNYTHIRLYEEEIDNCYTQIRTLENKTDQLAVSKRMAKFKLEECCEILDERKTRLERIEKYTDCKFVRNYIDDMGEMIRGINSRNVLNNIDTIVSKIEDTIMKNQERIMNLKNRINHCSNQIQYLQSYINLEEED